MDRVRPKILLIGDAKHREFHASVRWLRDETELSIAATVPSALQLDEHEAERWHTVIFAQARPGQFSRRDVEWISREIPLAHYVALLGSLCEGEAHHGGPWPGVVRVYWHQFLDRCRSELRLDLQPTSWQLPRTASEAERVEALMRNQPECGGGQVVVFTRSALLFDGLAAGCRAVGLSTVWSSHERRRNFQGAVAAIWDGTGQEAIDYDRLASITRQLPGMPVIVLMDFPRFDQVQRAQAHGARAVVSCPFMLPDLWTALGVWRRTPSGESGTAF